MRYSDDNLFDEEAEFHRTDSQAAAVIEQIKALQPTDLMLVRMAVLALAPPEDIDPEEEIANQLRNAQLLLAEVMSSTKSNVASKSSAMTAVNRALTQLVALQGKTYNINRLKALEKSITTVLHGHPDGEQLLAEWRQVFNRLVDAR